MILLRLGLELGIEFNLVKGYQMLKNLAFFLLALFSLSTRAELTSGPLGVLLVGSQNNVTSLLNDSMTAEFSRGLTSQIGDGVGYSSQFQGFFTGNTNIVVNLIPVTSGNSLEPTAYTLGFRWQTQRGDGKQHAISLISQIKNQASKRNDVSVSDNLTQYKSLPEQSQRCVDSLANDSELQLIKDKVALKSSDDTTFAMLANDKYPTDEEVKVIGLLAAKKDTCLKPWKTHQKFFPNDPLAPLYSASMDNTDQLLLSLYKKQITFGSFAKIRKENTARVDESRLKILAELKAQDAAANERAQRLAIEQQRLFIEEQKTYALLYRPPVETTQPVVNAQSSTTTNCQFLGSYVTCTTR